MGKKCSICNEEIEEDELGKLNGTVIKKKIGEKNKFEYICSECQKQEKQHNKA